MYAVIQTGGKQYRVEEGTRLRVEKLAGEPGAMIELTDVLLVADGDDVKVGKPVLKGAKVTARILGEEKGEKLLVFKFRRTRGYRRKNGHRQTYTALEVTGISA